jgi:phosphoribosyl 1,2-cyclic phosphodiesterase
MIEAGIDFKKVKQAVNFKISNIVGCLISHIHSDHSKYTKDILNSCIQVYTSEKTKEKLEIHSNRLIAVEPDIQFQIDEFSVIPFEVPHDAPCFGFLINHTESGVILFLTDCYYSPKRFQSLSNILIEANYNYSILHSNLKKGIISKTQYNRVISSHLSFETCLKTLLANDLSKVNNIVLIHLSNDNSNALDFQEGIRKATGKTIHVADNGIVIDFNKTPF